MGTEIHWLAVIAAALAGFVIGGLWYGPLFGRKWAEARGLDAEKLKQGANMALIFGTTFVLNLFMAFILDHTLASYGVPSTELSLMIAGGVAVGFIIPAMAVNYLFSRLTITLFAIDAGYWLVNYLVMGGLIVLLR
ncbi:DUF1761 domain-containing protein [Sphingomonas canadensis]|uniref:DUF1761 domain-containing protein n=1 Tax=Sphingomonas canadensis TaxID=1219257 RepID=A0ABW3H9U1_9SPHN|nr:DUF1761 domain-containing protein [Sphingomonas canadensis]MCW3837735.1 DUF1761 domain-containing protein [Sphingomonas canadensis]